MSLGGGDERNERNRLHGAKMASVTYPPLTSQNHRFPPLINVAATQSPGRFGPNQRGRRLIVMSLGGGDERNVRNRPHGAKMAAVTYPP